MIGPEAFCLVVVTVLLWVTFSGRDAWPLSSYPMFSGRLRLEDVEVFRVALESQDGSVHWWCPHYYRYAEEVGRQLQQLHHTVPHNPPARAAVAMAQQYVLREVVRLTRLEQGGAAGWRAVHLIRRTVRPTTGGTLTVHDETVLIKTWVELKGMEA